MPRIKLSPQEQYQHVCHAAIRVTDLNYGKHLGNDSLVGLIHEARVRFLRDMGFAEGDLGDGKTGIAMADLVVNYRGEGFLFDDLKIESSIGEIHGTGFRMFHRISTGDRLIALAEVGIAAFDYRKRGLSRIPTEFQDGFSAYVDRSTTA